MTSTLAGLRSLVELAASHRREGREPGEMDLAELHVCRTPAGEDWVLGQGTFGTVRLPPCFSCCKNQKSRVEAIQLDGVWGFCPPCKARAGKGRGLALNAPPSMVSCPALLCIC